MIIEERKEKRPSFQFYPKDFLTDSKVILMNSEIRGIYITLLCIDWLDDGIPENKQTWLNLGGYSFFDQDGDLRPSEDASGAIAVLSECFMAHPSKKGFMTNRRLYSERQKQDSYIHKQSDNGKIGAKNRWKKENGGANGGAMLSPMAKNGSSSSSSSSLKTKDIVARQKTAPEPAVKTLSQNFKTELEALLGEKASAFSWGAAGRGFKALLSDFGADEIERRMRAWFESTDDFVVNAGFPVTLFFNKFNLLKDGPIEQKSKPWEKKSTWTDSARAELEKKIQSKE